MEDMKRILIKAIADLREKESLELVSKMLVSGFPPLEIIEAARKGMEEVGSRYERREYYLSALIMSGEIFDEIVSLLDSVMKLDEIDKDAPQVIIGAPLGDIHDIGKNIVAGQLRCSGFRVVDLGVSVKPSSFIEAARETGAPVIGMSTLITAAYESIKETVLSLKKAGLYSAVKVMIGGGAVNEKVCEYACADAWGRDAADAVKLAKRFTGQN